MLEDMGNAVKIGDVIIPAVNVQVEGYPGWQKYKDGKEYWYGVYFEILFETGRYWVVDQGSEERYPDRIIVEEYISSRKLVVDQHYNPLNWDDFLTLYKEKING